MSAVQELYESQIKSLAVAERLQLVRLIMDELADSAPQWTVEVSDVWSPEDLEDVRTVSLLYAGRILGDQDVEPR